MRGRNMGPRRSPVPATLSTRRSSVPSSLEVRATSGSIRDGAGRHLRWLLKCGEPADGGVGWRELRGATIDATPQVAASTRAMHDRARPAVEARESGCAGQPTSRPRRPSRPSRRRSVAESSWSRRPTSSEEPVQRLRCAPLHGLGHVRIEVQGDRDGCVPKHLTGHLRVYAAAQHECRSRVAQIMEADVRER